MLFEFEDMRRKGLRKERRGEERRGGGEERIGNEMK